MSFIIKAALAQTIQKGNTLYSIYLKNTKIHVTLDMEMFISS